MNFLERQIVVRSEIQMPKRMINKRILIICSLILLVPYLWLLNTTGAITTENNPKDNLPKTKLKADGTTNIFGEGKEFIYYTIKSGDSLSKLAKRYYGDPKKYYLIENHNDLIDSNHIVVGQKIKIPKLDQSSSSNIKLNFIQKAERQVLNLYNKNAESYYFGIKLKELIIFIPGILGIIVLFLWLFMGKHKYGLVVKEIQRQKEKAEKQKVDFRGSSHPRFISPEVKQEVWKRDEGKCQMCGTKEAIQYDHIISVSKGGSNTARNIQLLCKECKEKSDKIGGFNKEELGKKFGTLILSDGSKYVGGIKEGKRHGQGTEVSPDGWKYEGEWKDDRIHGQGTRTSPDGLILEGEFKDGVLHGQGTATFSDGRKYEGEWKDDKRHGQGTWTFSDGRKYEGEWEDNKRHGQGAEVSSDGWKYEGEYKDGKRHGQGTLTSPDGWKWEGKFKDGELIKGTRTSPDGDKYEGDYKDSKPHGQGAFTFADGSIWKGEWKDGKIIKGTQPNPNGW